MSNIPLPAARRRGGSPQWSASLRGAPCTRLDCTFTKIQFCCVHVSQINLHEVVCEDINVMSSVTYVLLGSFWLFMYRMPTISISWCDTFGCPDAMPRNLTNKNRLLTRYSTFALKSSPAREGIVMRTNLHDVFLHPVIVAIYTIPPDVWLLRDEFAILHAPKLLTQIAFWINTCFLPARHVNISAAESLLLQIGVKLLESYQGICSALVSHYVSHALL